MINVLYIGNNLKNKRSNISGVQTLGVLLEGDGFTVYYASSIPNKILRLLDMLWCVFKLQHKVDYVLIDTYSTQNFYYALLVSQCCRLFKIPYVPILHGGNLSARLENNPKLSAAIFKNAHQNVSPSLFLKEIFQNYGYDTIHISNAIEIQNYPLTCKTFDAPKLLWVRSFSKIYNPKLAIRVFSILKKTYPNATLCMVGPDSDGTLRKVSDLALELNLNVKFTGKLSKSEWIALSKQYNIFINTTNVDNTPVSVIEAMALGFPIVSTNVGGIPFLISHNDDGVLVSPNDIDAMVNAIIKIQLDQNLRTNLMTNARLKSEHFTWSAIKPLWKSLLS
ncbi:glycosyltransferase family 4 protein [Winogradskyella psychrotolerans]|uniref:glycosyltransferase family 4 protein n=1 Tax=Winogradskyella psychrotolerans TaxID=1344585 RepID=UPI001C07B651|nr:glycosyltransferase family 4 protein [Winogradskyella psychrotolerans]MBU2929537.1 glycosyltransferase family 4 protein [Winogradskyella psychrotolerans]